MLFGFPRNVQPIGSCTEISQMWQFSCPPVNTHGLNLISDLKQERFYLGLKLQSLRIKSNKINTRKSQYAEVFFVA